MLWVRAASHPKASVPRLCPPSPLHGNPSQVHARHAELMGRLQEERERRLLELETLWRAARTAMRALSRRSPVHCNPVCARCNQGASAKGSTSACHWKSGRSARAGSRSS
jgi:hypothetical protein